MPTVVLNAYTKAYPSITNRIRASVALQTDPQALVASQIDSVAGHPQRIWTFPGLPRENYSFSLDEIDVSDNVVNNLALFDVVPGQLDGSLIRDDEQILVGTTPGFDDTASSFTFDGTETSPGSGIFKSDYREWEIVPSELTGRGILVRGIDYSWDKTFGVLTLLAPLDILTTGVWYNIHFNPILNPAGNSYPTVTDFACNLITNDTTLTPSYFSDKLICEPAGSYMEVTLPDILTVVRGRRLMVEVGGTGIACVKFIPNGTDTISWLSGGLYAMKGESFSIYKFTRAPGVHEWRVYEADGNFKRVGENVSDDMISSGVYNKQMLDGTIAATDTYARIYNNFVLQLPLSEVIDFDLWSTGNNKYRYALANSSNPTFADKFRFPDRRGLFEKNLTSGYAGAYTADSIGDMSSVTIEIRDGSGGTLTGTILNTGFAGQDVPTSWLPNNTGAGAKYIRLTGGTETQPKNYSINKYALL